MEEQVIRSENAITEFYLWETPEGDLRVRLVPEAANRLLVEIGRISSGSARPAVEIGGILLGSTSSEGGRTVTIRAFQPIPSEHSFGRTYTLSERDRLRFAATVSQCKANTTKDLAVVGYYRSHLRDDLFHDARDLSLIKTYLPEPENISLLVKPHDDGSCTVGVYYFRDGLIRSDTRRLDIPLGAAHAEAGSGAAEVDRGAGEVLPPTPLVQDEMLVPLEDRDLMVPNSGSRWKAWKVVVGTLVVVLTMGVALRTVLRHRVAQKVAVPANTEPHSKLGLQVDSSSNRLILRWNRNAPEIAAARFGILLIQDGEFQKVVELDTNQLRSGSIYYLPGGGDLEFRMEVFGVGEKSTAESIRVLTAPGMASAAKPGLKSSGDGNANTLPDPFVVDTARQTLPPTPETSRRGASEPPPEEVPAEPPVRPVKKLDVKALFQNESPPQKPVTLNMPPPQLKVGETAAVKLPATKLSSVPPPPPKPAEKTTTAAQAISPPITAPTPNPTPPVSGGGYEGPKIIQRVSPVVPARVRDLLTNDAVVNVRVVIDDTGKVIDATVTERKGPINLFLTGAALHAAKAWRFEPAKSNGRNVASEMILNFAFQK